MADMFNVFDIPSGRMTTMDYPTICSTYDKANLNILKAKSISIISVFDNGKKIAVINRIKEREESYV